MKSKLVQIYQAIAETKRDIATLHRIGFGEEQISSVSDQLDAVVAHTELATEAILAAAEQIDNNAANLAATLASPESEMATDIQDQVIRIFESCNFQDITGQRITKVINTLKFIEERVSSMMETCGSIDSSGGLAPLEMEQPHGNSAVLNASALPAAENTASQDDIDALFD